VTCAQFQAFPRTPDPRVACGPLRDGVPLGAFLYNVRGGGMNKGKKELASAGSRPVRGFGLRRELPAARRASMSDASRDDAN
jgi:hypothetical protein